MSLRQAFSADYSVIDSYIPPCTIVPKNYSILLIDDDRDQLFLFQHLLEKAGYQVQTASSSDIALRKVSQRQFDIVVTDIKMPGKNGFDFINAIRSGSSAFSTAKRVAIIALTACSSDLEFDALKAGADMFCEKRLATKLLIKQIKMLLET